MTKQIMIVGVGGQGTLLAAMVMRELPIGFPKMIVSTIVNLRTPPFEGVKDKSVGKFRRFFIGRFRKRKISNKMAWKVSFYAWRGLHNSMKCV